MGQVPYISFAVELCEKHYNGKYDINSTDFAKLFIREVSAYVNQYVTADIQYANERFSGIFSDWQSVVEASRQFNKNIGADFSGSAFLRPKMTLMSRYSKGYPVRTVRLILTSVQTANFSAQRF